MSRSDRPDATAKEKARLLEALKQLHREGVRILDDQAGRLHVARPSKKDVTSEAANTASPFLDSETSFDLEDQVGNDPYNKFL